MEEAEGFNLIFARFKFPGCRGTFFMPSPYNTGANQGFGENFTRGSRTVVELSSSCILAEDLDAGGVHSDSPPPPPPAR